LVNGEEALMMTISGTIPIRLPTLNTLLRMHWAKRKALLAQVSMFVCASVGARSGAPMARAHVDIKRYSTQEPDVDGMPGTAKLILDVFQPASKRHPCGLGYILDDSSKCITLAVTHVKSREKRTDFLITEIAA
jgi:hypothetical protein